jgi:hypothetical protein
MRVDAAVTLPDIPEPVVVEPVVVEPRPPRKLTPQELARVAEERRRHLNFNAEVYENGVSIIHWQHPDTAEPYEAICGFDVNLLAGFGHFTSAGKTYQLSFIPPGVIPPIRRQFSKLPIPLTPEAAPAPGTVTFAKGDPNDPVGTATAILLRDLIASEKSRLIAYQEERKWGQASRNHKLLADPLPKVSSAIWSASCRQSG